MEKRRPKQPELEFENEKEPMLPLGDVLDELEKEFDNEDEEEL